MSPFTILVDPRAMGSWEHFTGAQVAREVARILVAALAAEHVDATSVGVEVIDWTGNADDRDPRLDRAPFEVQRAAWGLVPETLRRLSSLNPSALPLTDAQVADVVHGDNGVDEDGYPLARGLADAMGREEDC